MITLDIFSDPVCPWCMIGKANLDRALERLGDHPFRIEWHPFQLNPDMPREGIDRASFFEAKFGGKAKVQQAYDSVAAAAAKAGVEFNIDRIARQPNTLDAHRLIHWAGLEGKQNAVVSALFRAFFRDGRDIGDATVLAEVGAGSGMDRSMLDRLLASDADRDDIRARDQDARHKGVQAVPTFLVARQYVVSGAQPPELWVQVAEELAAKARDGA